MRQEEGKQEKKLLHLLGTVPGSRRRMREKHRFDHYVVLHYRGC
jgi:hypothetical protein